MVALLFVGSGTYLGVRFAAKTSSLGGNSWALNEYSVWFWNCGDEIVLCAYRKIFSLSVGIAYLLVHISLCAKYFETRRGKSRLI